MVRTPLLLTAAGALACGLVLGTAPAESLPGWQTAATSDQNPRAHQPSVVDVRYAEHPGFDRVVIDVRGRRPGYAIRYTPVLRFDGSGAKAPLPGRSNLTLVVEPAVAHDQAGNSVYDGPTRRRLDYPALRGIRLLGDYEGRVSFGFGLDQRTPYRVFTLTHPSRIVVDFKH